MQARYQDPLIGRFLSIDPVTFMDTGSPSYFNRYSYVANDPINLIDPTGMYHCSESDCAVVDEVYNGLVEVRDGLDEGSADRGLLDGVLDAIGEKGAEGSPLIELDSTIDSVGSHLEGSNTIKLNPEFAKVGPEGALSPSAMVGTLGHEGAHLEDYEKKGPMQNIGDRRATEHHAYTVSNIIGKAKYGDLYNSGNIEDSVNRSVSVCAGSAHPSCN